MPPSVPDKRRKRTGAAFLVVWMTFWLAAIFVAVWTMGASALSGEAGAAIVLLIWVGAALFGLVSAGRSLKAILLDERRVRPTWRDHRWNDGLDPAPAAEPASAAAATPPAAEQVPPLPPADAPSGGRRS